MELPSKLLEQIAVNTRPKIEDHILIVMDKSTHEKHLFQQLQTKNKQFKTANTFLTDYNGVFNGTNSNKKLYFAKMITDKDGFLQITIPQNAFELESLTNEIRRIIIDEGHFTQTDYQFRIIPFFLTLGSIIEISEQGPLIRFQPDGSTRNFLGFNASTI